MFSIACVDSLQSMFNTTMEKQERSDIAKHQTREKILFLSSRRLFYQQKVPNHFTIWRLTPYLHCIPYQDFTCKVIMPSHSQCAFSFHCTNQEVIVHDLPAITAGSCQSTSKWHSCRKEKEDAPSLEVFMAGLDGALSNLLQ